MQTVETRCTQCGTTNTQTVPRQNLNHGGTAHGTEVLFCPACSGTCNLDECREGSPCERCHTETVQNRCGRSVPAPKQR